MGTSCGLRTVGFGSIWSYVGVVVDYLVMVNGVPGAGKTSLARLLASTLRIPLVSKDAIKEALSDAVGVPLPPSQLGAIAADNLWTIAGMLDGMVIVESFWSTGRDEPYVRDALASLGLPPGLEVWCDVPLALARRRFVSRDRHPVHTDGMRVEDWERLTARAEPISGLPVLTVATDREVDIERLAAAILVQKNQTPG